VSKREGKCETSRRRLREGTGREKRGKRKGEEGNGNGRDRGIVTIPSFSS